jgi:[methyl-Co(III) methanol-specific corrinoid protein]:coenzyme M methyltransferase
LENSPRSRVLKLFNRQSIDYIPVFSGFGNITLLGLEKLGWKFWQIHEDTLKMAETAASTYELFDFECAVVPFDMGVVAEALGCEVNFYPHHAKIIYPTISRHVAETVAELEHELIVPKDMTNAGRIFQVKEALRWLKGTVGEEVAVGAWVLGPYALARQLLNPEDLSASVLERWDMVNKILDTLTGVIIEVIREYQEGGADYITVREDREEPKVFSPSKFESMIKPHLNRLFSKVSISSIIHIKGDINEIADKVGSCGADAIAIDDENNIGEIRQKLGEEALIFGGVGSRILAEGTETDIDQAVKLAIGDGISAIWPTTDIHPEVSRGNIEAMIRSARKYGKL